MAQAQVVGWESLLLAESRLDDFYRFTVAQVRARDIDPLYPVLERVFGKWYRQDTESITWAIVVYVAYYNAASALTVLSKLPDRDIPAGEIARLPTGIERRGLRGGTPLTQHLTDVRAQAEFYGSFSGWLQDGWTGDPEDDWQATRRQALTAWGNGRWATYKLAEVLQKVAHWQIAAPDMGMDGASGPKQGLELLFGPQPNTAAYESAGRWLWRKAVDLGIEVDLAEIETCLCDYHGMVIGRYYPGHDVGLLYDDVHKLDDGPARRALIEAAEAVLPEKYWRPVDAARRRFFRESGSILTW